MKSLLVVCEGNICRSPMAEALFSHALPDLKVHSAGLSALVGEPADEKAVELIKARGLPIEGHRATQITRLMCLESDIVFVMDKDQRQRLEKLYPQACGRIFRLGEFGNRDVPDPYGKSKDAFATTLSLIDDCVAQWLQRIKRI